MDVVVGRIGRAHGVRGEVSVEIRTDEPDTRFAPGATLHAEPAAAGPLTVVSTRPHGARLLVSFDQVADRSTAERLRGVLLTAPEERSDRPADPEEFYDRQLVGLRVRRDDGTDVGEVVDVRHGPAHDLLLVRRDAGGDVFVPFVAELVPDVDLETSTVVVVARPGLLDPETLE
ncbi:MAG: ribosome maturation factor RimM [Nocardioidaceae bacterium]